jgi:palmitoyltransferase
MDHHCPFTDNCVGWGNYKYYISLLVWGNATMVAWMIVTTVHVWKMVFGVAEGETPIEWSWYLFLMYAFIILAEGLLASLLISHVVFVLIDKTTIEWRETKHLGNMFSYWGNLGIWYTCTQRSLGSNPLLWLLPTRRSIAGDGVNFHKPFFRQVPKGSKDDPDAESNRPNAAQTTPPPEIGDKH